MQFDATLMCVSHYVRPWKMLPIFSIPSGVKSFDLSEKAGTNEHVANLERVFLRVRTYILLLFLPNGFSAKKSSLF